MFRIPVRQHRPKRENNRQKARVEAQRRQRDEKREQRRIEAERRRERRAGRPVEITTAPTAAGRYADRLAAFHEAFGDVGGWVHLAAWLAHNCVAHPLLGLFPGPWTVRLHDGTADWLNLRGEPSRSPVPVVRVWWAWVLHNCVAHPLIGLFPRDRWFGFHDATAERLGVDGWV